MPGSLIINDTPFYYPKYCGLDNKFMVTTFIDLLATSPLLKHVIRGERGFNILFLAYFRGILSGLIAKILTQNIFTHHYPISISKLKSDNATLFLV